MRKKRICTRLACFLTAITLKGARLSVRLLHCNHLTSLYYYYFFAIFFCVNLHSNYQPEIRQSRTHSYEITQRLSSLICQNNLKCYNNWNILNIHVNVNNWNILNWKILKTRSLTRHSKRVILITKLQFESDRSEWQKEIKLTNHF